MDKCLRIIFCLFLLFGSAAAQVVPSENSTLNYRLAGFSVAEKTNAKIYVFEIATGSISNENEFSDKVVIRQKAAIHRSVILLPSFGTSYTWRVIYADADDKQIGSSALYHCNTGVSECIDTTKYGMHTMKTANEYKGMLVLLDYVFAMYDLNGEPVWYVPQLFPKQKPGTEMRDLKPTADGTFTALCGSEAVEFDYNGKVLWSAPNDGQVSQEATEYYHHEITKLSNGHYMIAGYEKIVRKIPADPSVYYDPADSTFRKTKDGGYEKLIVSGTLIEYDNKGKVQWSWKASEHFTDKDFFRPKKAMMMPFNGNTYLNGFDFDETNKAIYISFRDINRVLKIEYPSGKVLHTWGESINSDLSIEPNSPFYGQHCIRLDKKTNHLLLFNNNVPNTLNAVTDNTSHVYICKQPTQPKGQLEKLWDLPCNLVNNMIPASTRFGSVNLLEDDCLLVCAGIAGRIFVANKDKQILWDAIPYATEIQPGAYPKRVLMPIYRTNYISEKDIEKFVFRQ